MKYANYLIIFLLASFGQVVLAQSKVSLVPGIFYNGGGFKEEVQGYGLAIGLEYKPITSHFFSLELRTKYGVYSFDDGTKWTEDVNGVLQPPKNLNKARLEYTLFSPQIGLVPKLYIDIDEDLSLFLENEFSTGLMSGNFKYGGQPYAKKNITEPIFNYSIGFGVEYGMNKYSFVGSIGYSTLNFRGKIWKHQPKNYQGQIPNQSAGLIINIMLKVPL
ncbi:MAG: hypothetical protein LBT43_00830 [Prevotella sp.]|jgi:hypothetical protein|nr:hypothetical protein [Prevotella sp.]